MKKQYLVPTMEQSVLEPQGNLLQAISDPGKGEIPEETAREGGFL